MAWEWTAAYVLNRTQADVAAKLRSTINQETRGLFYLSDDFGSVPIPYLALACVSLKKKGWVGIWYDSFWFLVKTFQQHRFTGLVIGSEDELKLDTDRNGWSYMLWDKGKIVDWFIYHPEFYFSDVASLYRIFFKTYLETKGISIPSPLPNEYWIERTAFDSPPLFQGNPELLRSLTSSEASTSEIESWWKLNARDAMALLPHIVPIPFAGIDYNIQDISAFIDTQRGIFKEPINLHRLELNLEKPFAYKRSQEWKQAVSQFQLMFFKAGPSGRDYDKIHEIFWEIL